MSRDYEYINKWASENYDRITIIVPKGSKERIKQAARDRGQTVTEYIASMMPKTLIGRWKRKGQSTENTDDG